MPARRGTGQPAEPPAERRKRQPVRELPPIERARVLVDALNEKNDLDPYEREAYYDEHFRRLYGRCGLGMMWETRLIRSVRDDVGRQWEVRAIELHPDGPMLGHLLIMWEEGPFATLLLADSDERS